MSFVRAKLRVGKFTLSHIILAECAHLSMELGNSHFSASSSVVRAVQNWRDELVDLDHDRILRKKKFLVQLAEVGSLCFHK